MYLRSNGLGRNARLYASSAYGTGLNLARAAFQVLEVNAYSAPDCLRIAAKLRRHFTGLLDATPGYLRLLNKTEVQARSIFLFDLLGAP